MKNRILIILIFISQLINAQTKIIVPKYVRMPKDTVIKKQIIKDLNNFLTATQKENELNKYILPTQKVETYILADEFRNVEKSRKSEHFFKAYLNNLVKINKDKYFIQISNIGVSDSIPYLRTLFNLIAYKKDNSFLFSSPLKENTKNWKNIKIKNFTFYYKNSFNLKKAKEYVKLANAFDEKLNSKDKTTKIYCATNRVELLKLIGVDFKLDYNGRTSGVFSSLNGNEQLIVLGNNSDKFDNFDTHDLWHDRLSLVISRKKVNKHVDEGCAYLYGGSWGMSWNTIFKRFMEKVANNKDADWLYYKENRVNFGESQAEHLMVDYVITALIIKKIEKEKGFEGVWKLLNSKGNEKYFKTLNELTGISKKNYNEEVWKLIKQENKK